MKNILACWLLYLLFHSVAAIGQTPTIDSLKKKLSYASNPQERLELLFGLCEQRESLGADSLYRYALLAKNITIDLHNNEQSDQADFYLINVPFKRGELEKALDQTNILQKKTAKYPVSSWLNINIALMKGRILVRLNKYKEALSEYYKVLNIAEENNDADIKAASANGIGWVYMEMEQYPESIRWLQYSLHTYKGGAYSRAITLAYSNMADVYNNINKFDSAEYFINEAIVHSKEIQNLTLLANSMNILGDVYINTNRKALAEKTLNQALEIRKQIGDPFYIVSDMAQIGLFYANSQQTEKGINICKEGIAIAMQYQLSSKLLILYEALAKNYEAAGDYEKYSKVLKQTIDLKDSVYKINSAQSLAEMQTKYELQQKENLIIRQQYDLSIKNYFFYGSLLLLALGAGISYLFFNEYKKRQRMKIALMVTEDQRERKLAIMQAEENQRKRIAADLHDNLGLQANAILYNTELLHQDQGQQDALVQNLKDTAKDMLLMLRETLWAMKTADVTATDTWLRLINFCKQMNRHYQNIKILTSDAAPANFIINSGMALNALLIMQEAINNAVRHSKSEMIRVNSKMTEKKWQITIEDNGEGFDLEEMKKKQDSYGLNSMMDRARVAGLYLEINSQPSKGTIVDLYIPENTETT